ncbi:MAG: hypothetical protein ACI4OX_01285 [Akkermansia sp.]
MNTILTNTTHAAASSAAESHRAFYPVNVWSVYTACAEKTDTLREWITAPKAQDGLNRAVDARKLAELARKKYLPHDHHAE